MGDNRKSSESDASTWDFDGQETQIFDSQFSDSSTSSPVNKVNDELQTLHGTIPFDDEFMTQVMDLDGETQLGGETQMVNLDAEIEEMDIPDSVEKNVTQLFDDFDTEDIVSDHQGTEIVDESDEEESESGRRALDLEHAHMYRCRHENKSKTDCQQHTTSGIGLKTFTSIRMASVRACGLAALNKASQSEKSPLCPSLSSEPDRRKLSPSQSHNVVDEFELGNKKRATARKLFAEDANTETNLSYLDSQEPGEASQANALNFVENFLKVNMECEFSKSTEGILKSKSKSNPALSAKGTRVLAKATNLMNAVGERGIFDWDNSREDEGGGEFFRKKKQMFLGKLSSSSSRKNKKQNKLEIDSKKNLINELDKQSDLDEPFDTQMAAEAMEDLCFAKTDKDSDLNRGEAEAMEKSHQILPEIKQSNIKRTHDQSNEVRELKKIVSCNEGERRRSKKQCVTTPIALRTRQSMKEKVKDDEINNLTGFYPKGKRSMKKMPSSSNIPRLTRSKSNISSPICMGDEYLKQSCRKSRIRSSLIQELSSLSPIGTSIVSPSKDSRKRKDMSLICVLFSRHLDGEIVKHQKKILSRLGGSESSSMSDATHFIADEFVRTRNMLEAIALGKPIVTHLWLESCLQAYCHIDEKNFILRDAKKEKEFGFSLPASLARARQNPLLKGKKVLITPNTKPGKDILANLVKAVLGVAVERIGRAALKDDKVPEGLLILSCEEDYTICLPFLEKGAAIYSSELVLNGIVTQKLDYQRHQLFLDHVKRTRSTIWVKKDDSLYKPAGLRK